jgi:hypothetical protein
MEVYAQCLKNRIIGCSEQELSIDAIIAALANIGAYLNHVWKNKLGLDFYGADFLGFLDMPHFRR